MESLLWGFVSISLSRPCVELLRNPIAAETKQRSSIDPWYRSGGGRGYLSADGQRCSVQLKLDPLNGGSYLWNSDE